MTELANPQGHELALLTDQNLRDWELTGSHHRVLGIVSTGPGTYTLQLAGAPGYGTCVSMVEAGCYEDFNEPVEPPFVTASSIDDVAAWLDALMVVFARCRYVTWVGYTVIFELAGAKNRG